MEVAGANRRCRCGCNPRRESAAAQLFSLGSITLYETIIIHRLFGCHWNHRLQKGRPRNEGFTRPADGRDGRYIAGRDCNSPASWIFISYEFHKWCLGDFM
jgi:hypothetical protein